MEDNNKVLQPIRNERGYFIIANSEGGPVPASLEKQIWLSEREAAIAVMLYEEQVKAIKAEEKPVKKEG